MKILDTLYSQPARLWTFLGLFQGPVMRLVHAIIVVFVLMQFATSALMTIHGDSVSLLGWLHIGLGISLCLLALVQTGLSLGTHGLRHFFPYLWGDTTQLRQDVADSLRFRLVAPSAGGLGATVQGLGMGALWLVAGSGLLWFLLWQAHSGFAGVFRSLHDAVSVLISLYFIGHGSMALIHFIAWQRDPSHQTGRL